MGRGEQLWDGEAWRRSVEVSKEAELRGCGSHSGWGFLEGQREKGGEVLLLGSSVCPVSGLLGITWHNRSDCSCRQLLASRQVWGIRVCGTLQKPQCGCFSCCCLRENRELWSLRTLGQTVIVSSGWQVQQLQKDCHQH